MKSKGLSGLLAVFLATNAWAQQPEPADPKAWLESLKQISTQMEQVEGSLVEQNTGATTVAAQEEIVSNLDRLIAQLEAIQRPEPKPKQPRSATTPSSATKPPKPGAGVKTKPTAPTTASASGSAQPNGPDRANGETGAAENQRANKDVWSADPRRKRETDAVGRSVDLPQIGGRYERLIRAYFKILSEDE